jgi:hypothetical protein
VPLKEEGTKEYFRVNSREGGSMVLDRNQGMVDRIFMMEGYTPLALQRIYPPGRDWNQTCDMLNAKYRIAVDRDGGKGLTRAAAYLPRAYMVYRAKILPAESDERTFMTSPEFDPSRMVALEEDAGISPDTSYAPGWTAAITSYTLNEITLDVNSPKDGILVLSEVYYPGWEALVDGKSETVLRADWNLRAIRMPRGAHTVRVRFEPRSFHTGLLVTSSALLLSLAGLGLSAVRGRSKRAASDTETT